MVFHPEFLVGFNKTQLLERHLFSSGFIGPRFRASPAFTIGNNYRQFLPKSETLHRYQHGITRIHIQAVGQWRTASGVLLDSTNLIIVEGDAFISAEKQCATFCALLKRITGDNYLIDTVSDVACLGIREMEANYQIHIDELVI